MMGKAGLFLLLLLLLVSSAAPGDAQAVRRLWVFDGRGEVTELDAATFNSIQKTKLPDGAVAESLQVNRRGHILVNLDDGSSENSRIWVWNGRKELTLSRGVIRKKVPGVAAVSFQESTPACFLGANDEKLYWFGNEFSKQLRKESEEETAVKTTFFAWLIDYARGARAQVESFVFPLCKCGTGVCSETCPEADPWVPEAGIDDFFLVTHWVPGQLGATYQSSFLYRQSKGQWSSQKLPEVLEKVEDAASPGTAVVYSLLDAGCCGWENESNDRTLLLRSGKEPLVLFDERARYQNPDYDVSFFVSKARLSRDAASVALTISSSASPQTEIRLSDSGKPDARELARIRQGIGDLPAVEVLRVDAAVRRTRYIPHAALAGWLSDREILILREGTLAAVDVGTGAERPSGLKLSGRARVFIR